MTVEYVSYRNARPYPFCPGCSHSMVLDYLNEALVQLQLDPHKVVVVTDIGCSGLSDQYFNTNAFHGLHGRAITYGTGLKLANPELKVIVIMGDGGCGIGGHHLLNAARRNIGLTVLVLNNFNYGMTGGQHSVTTPHGGITSTTKTGNLEQPLDIAETAAINGATFVVRTPVFNKELPHLIARAIGHEGFSLLDIWELCAAYYVPNNTFNRKSLEESISNLGFRSGIIREGEREEYTQCYRRLQSVEQERRSLQPQPLKPRFTATLERPVRMVIAGSAGQKVVSSAAILGTAAVLSGLWATKRDDYAVTVMTGHSVSEVIVSPNEIFYTGIERPDILLALAPEGTTVVKRQLEALTPTCTLYIKRDLLPVETKAQVVPLDLSRVPRKETAAAGIGAMLYHSDLLSQEALKEATRITQPAEIARQTLSTLERSSTLIAS